MLKIIPNDALAMSLFKVTERIKDGCGYSKEYLLHEDMLFVLGEPYSLCFHLKEKRITKCKPRNEIETDFEDAIKLKPSSIPSALINMIAHTFNLWLGFVPYADQGVFHDLNKDANVHLNRHSITVKVSDKEFVITHRGKKVTYEQAVKVLC